MVGREEKRSKYERWALYLPSGPRLKRWKRCLRETVEAGYAKVQMEEVSGTRVDLVWPHAVTWDSARRVMRLATKKDSSFHILGEPRPIVVESAASAPAKKRRLWLRVPIKQPTTDSNVFLSFPLGLGPSPAQCLGSTRHGASICRPD